MKEIRLNDDNVASVIMGKDCFQSWRGQSDIVVYVPFDSWLKFIQENFRFLKYRPVLDYSKIFECDDITRKYRYFFYEIAWSLHNEVAYSSNNGLSATVILPEFEDIPRVELTTIRSDIENLDDATIDKFFTKIANANRLYAQIFADEHMPVVCNKGQLNDWNLFILKLSTYLYMHSVAKLNLKPKNIIWR